MWQVRGPNLDSSLLPKGLGGKIERERGNREKTNLRERESNFSLDFQALGPSVLVGVRGEVALRCKSYAWAPVLWSFDNSGR